MTDLNLTPDQILAVKAVMMDLLGDDDFDCYNVVSTQETLEDFESAKKSWTDYRFFEHKVVKGLPIITVDNVQMGKGRDRRNLKIIDAGSCRIVIW